MTNFSSDLILWYKENKRSLPWRQTKDPYQVWVSEIILQQTRVNQGLSYYMRFLDNFPTVHDLAKASEDEVLKCWQGLGYYSRARNMHFSAKQIAEQLNGKFPTTYNELIKLKGVGTYTAAAISSICFNEYRTVVDGNVFRVLTRLFGIETPINTANGKKEIEELAHSLNSGSDFGEFNQAIMEFGALHCTPKQAKCSSCIFHNQCNARVNNKVEFLPVKEAKAKVKSRYLNFIHIQDKEGNTLIQKRDGKDIWKGLYQFPLNETTKQTATKAILNSKEFKEFIGDKPIYIISEQNSTHLLTHRKLFVKIINIKVDSFSRIVNSSYLLVHKNELNDFAFPKPIERYLN